MSSENKEGKQTNGSSFEYPDMYYFPPFFTLQPVQETRTKQLAMWVELVTSWCNHHRIRTIQIDDPKCKLLFSNPQINRQLSQDAIVTVLDAVRDAHFGTWESKDKTVFALSPVSLSALANEIYEYAENYNLIDNVATLEELTTGEETRKEVFHGLSAHVVEGALRLLVDQGKALLIAGSSLSELGIKFLRK